MPLVRGPLLPATLLLSGAVLAGGCAAPMLERSEAETAEILDELDTRVRGEREVALKAMEDAEEFGGEVSERPPPPQVPETIDLLEALRLAAVHNRDLETSREGLELSAVALINARRDVGPRLSGSLSYLLADSDLADEATRTDAASLSMTDLLPTGGDLTVGADATRSHGRGDGIDSTAEGDWSVRLTQPLLADAGYESSHEALTDAQRQALYDVRDFELSRQDLALRVQRDFFSLVAQRRVIGNRELSLENFEFLKRKSEALFEVGRVSEVDKFRATREYLTAENALIDAQQEYDARLDRFKILLGLDTSVEFEIADEIPPSTELPEFALATAFRVALANRLDVMTARDQVDDAGRRVRIRERDLLPRLDVDAVLNRSSETERRVSELRPDSDDWSIGVSLELPLDRVRERGALRSARIALDRARRSMALLEDNVLLQVRESLRNVRSSANSLDIQEQIVESEAKNAKVARMRFEQGEISNRDLTDALLGLADARDRLVREKANLETARMQLLRDLGVLVLEEDGTWQQ